VDDSTESRQNHPSRADMDIDEEPQTDSDVAMATDALPSTNPTAASTAEASPIQRVSVEQGESSSRPTPLAFRNMIAGSSHGSSPVSGSSGGRTITVPAVDEKAQSELRRKIMDIQRDPTISFADKAGMIQVQYAHPRRPILWHCSA